ncbi:MAG: flagellar hook-basal body complex protein [Sphingobium sp.]
MSFYISLTGLKGAQADLTTISNNVANVGATAFKKSRAEFGDIFVGQSNGLGQGTRYLGAQQQFTQGTLETTDKTLDLAVVGEGFFTVKSPSSDGQISYTRNGAFGTDKNNYIVDTLGNRVQVLPVDADGKIVSTAGSSLIDLKLPTDDGGSVAGSAYVAGSATINQTTGVVTVSFANGTTKTLSPAVTLPTGNDAIPAATYVAGQTTIDTTTGVVTAKYNDGNSFALTPAVTLTQYKSLDNGDGTWTQYPISSATVADDGTITVDYGAAGTETIAGPVPPATHQTQPAFVSAAVGDDGGVVVTFADGSQRRLDTTVTIPADDGGSAPSPLSSIGIDQNGIVVATFANGTTRALGALAMATFTNQQGLNQSGDAHWTVSRDSGEPIYGGANDGAFGQVRSGMLERSNVDITEELVALIAAQRNFQANAKAIEAANTLTTTINNLRS